MNGFELINGDLVIVGNEISMIEGNNLTTQTIQSVLSTNKGEWIFDPDEGVDFDIVLNGTENEVRAEIDDGTKQVDNTLSVVDFTLTDNRTTRIRTTQFTATAQSGATLEVSNSWR